MVTNEKYSPSLLERIVNGAVQPLPARLSIKITDFHGGKMSWEFKRIPVASPLPNGNLPND